MLSLITGLLSSLGSVASGGAGPIIGIVLGVVVVFGGGFYGGYHWESATLNAYEASIQAKAAADNAAALQVLQQHDAQANAAVTAAQADAATRQQQLQTLQNEINNAPRSSTCASSPAVRALLNGMRAPSNH